MSSLLQRLAGVALGRPTATLHAIARLPYQAPPALMPAEAGAPAALQPAGPAPAYDAPLPTVTPPRADALRPPDRPTAPPATASAHAPTPPQARHHPIDTPTGAPEAARPQPTPTLHRQTPDAAPAERVGIAIDPPAGPSARSAAAWPAPVAERAATPPPEAASARPAPPAQQPGFRLETSVARPTTALPTRLPNALLPQAPDSPRLRPTSPTALRPPARPQAAAAAEPDIHVHIGRVEVTAVHRPAEPPRRSPPSRPQPMSLDEYLARREGRQP